MLFAVLFLFTLNSVSLLHWVKKDPKIDVEYVTFNKITQLREKTFRLRSSARVLLVLSLERTCMLAFHFVSLSDCVEMVN